MKLLRIYVDTSVFGGCFDEEFVEWSTALMEDFREHRFQCVLSDVTAAEVAMAPEIIRELFEELLARAEALQVTPEAMELLSAYESHAILGPRYRNDMLHIALATVGEVDVVVSWNFKHIVRLDKIRLFNAVNLELGYKALSIYSPREVATHGTED
ncbi:MAG: PIN domain-containing protein [Thermodesulfobacteriota bacterium]|jgi:predicted nucleic acid-binding protein